MREMSYQQGRIELPSLQVSESPQMPNRGMYLWARKDFFGNPDQVDRYVEEFALWGCNGLALWFEMGMFQSFDDPEAKRWLEIYRRLYETARRMGMKTGLLMVMNDAYKTSPVGMRIAPIIGCPNHYLCPSKTGSVEQIIAWQEQVFKALPKIDIFNLFSRWIPLPQNHKRMFWDLGRHSRLTPFVTPFDRGFSVNARIRLFRHPAIQSRQPGLFVRPSRPLLSRRSGPAARLAALDRQSG